MVEATLFIPLVIVGVVQAIKYLAPKVNGFVTIMVALVVGVLVAVFDKQIGVVDITVAQGVVFAFGSVGITSVASKVGVSLTPDRA